MLLGAPCQLDALLDKKPLMLDSCKYENKKPSRRIVWTLHHLYKTKQEVNVLWGSNYIDNNSNEKMMTWGG